MRPKSGKRLIFAILATVSIAIPMDASPLTWFFTGKTTADGTFNGRPIAQDLYFQLRVFLDTDLVGERLDNPEVIFSDPKGPLLAEVAIETLGVLPVTPFAAVEYFIKCFADPCSDLSPVGVPD